MLGDGEGNEEERGHCEEEMVPGWTAATDALLQFWDLRVVIIICREKKEKEIIQQNSSLSMASVVYIRYY